MASVGARIVGFGLSSSFTLPSELYTSAFIVEYANWGMEDRYKGALERYLAVLKDFMVREEELFCRCLDTEYDHDI